MPSTSTARRPRPDTKYLPKSEVVNTVRRILIFVVGVTFCAALAGCGGSDEPKGPGYTPIPDKRLFAQIAAIPGVRGVAIKHLDTFDNPNDYVGDVEVNPSADAAAILDQALAILRQGRWRAGMGISAVQDTRVVSTDVLGIKSPTDEFLAERYGPQPGNGLPPTAAPTPSP